MKTVLTVLALYMMIALPAAAAKKSDQDFVNAAAQAGIAEVEASKLALDKSKDEAVRKFAQRMVDDHTKANEKLKAIAQSKNLKVATWPSKKQQKKIDSLRKVSGGEFDERYAEFFGVPAHKEAINLFEREAKSGNDKDLRQFAQDTLPTLREHLQMAQGLQG